MNVDPKVLLPVRRIKEAALDYLDKHPWTYELNPKKMTGATYPSQRKHFNSQSDSQIKHKFRLKII